MLYCRATDNQHHLTSLRNAVAKVIGYVRDRLYRLCKMVEDFISILQDMTSKSDTELKEVVK